LIDFRYHLVSIVAIFLALTVGIVLGTTALNGPVLTDLRARVDGLAADKRGLEGQVLDLRGQNESGERFAAAVAPTVVAGRLANDPVLVISTPGASTDIRDAVVTMLRAAGAVPSGRLRLRNEYVAPDKAAVIDDLVTRLAPPGLSLPAGEEGTRAGTELAGVLAYPGSGSRSVPQDATAGVVAGFREASLLTVDGPDPTPAPMVVIVAGPAPTKASDDDRKAAAVLLALADAMGRRGAATVVVGPRTAADDGGLLGALRSSPAVAGTVSSVDGADSSVGRVATVLALAGRARGEVGQYGTGRGAGAPPPVPATPTPAATGAP
jgi:hypothetical protein